VTKIRGKPKLLEKDGVNPYDAPVGYIAQLSNECCRSKLTGEYCEFTNKKCPPGGGCLGNNRADGKFVMFVKVRQ
jgi:hypothetical protein